MPNIRALLNIALVILLGVLGAVAFYEPGVDKPAGPEKLSALLAKDVDRIAISNTGSEPLLLIKKNNHWQLQASSLHNGDPLPANMWRVEKMSQLVEANVILKITVEEDKLAQFGLATPHLTATINDKTIAFGSQEPIKSRRYVKLDDSVYLIDNTLYMMFVATASALVDTALLPGNPVVTELRLPELTLTQHEGKWLSTPPVSVSYDIINTLIDEWRFAQALEIEPYHQQPALAPISLRLDNGVMISFALLQKEPEFVLARPELGLVYRFTKNTAERLLTLAKPDDATIKP